MTTSIQINTLSKIGPTSVQNEYNKLVARLRNVHVQLDGIEVDVEFMNAYSKLCGKVFELSGGINMLNVWANCGQTGTEKFSDFGDSMLRVKDELENVEMIVNLMVSVKQKVEKSNVFEFRRVA